MAGVSVSPRVWKQRHESPETLLKLKSRTRARYARWLTQNGKLFVSARLFPYDTTTLAPELVKQWQEIWYHAVDVSLIRLIATPELFDNTPVRVTGIICTTEFGVLLFLDRESYEYFITANAVSIMLPNSFLDHEMLPQIEGKYVEIVGRFRNEHMGHHFINGSLYDVLPIKPGHILSPIINTED